MHNDNDSTKRWVAVVLGPLALGATLLGGCVEANPGLVIVQAQAPVIKDNACEIPAERTNNRIGSGVFDVALDKHYPYELYPLIKNNLPDLTEGLNPNRVTVTAYQVRIEPPPTINVAWRADCPAQFDHPTTVDLNSGDEKSDIAEVMRPCHSKLLRELFATGKLSTDLSEQIRFRVIVKAKGRHGGTTITSDPFEFPIRVCYGCLQVGYPDPAFVDFSFPTVVSCNQLSQNPYVGNVCNPAQDFGPILCCARDAKETDIECPAVPRAPSATTP